MGSEGQVTPSEGGKASQAGRKAWKAWRGRVSGIFWKWKKALWLVQPERGQGEQP